MQKIDLHIHTVHSDSPLTVAEVARRARRAKVVAGICDHLSPYHKMFEAGAFDDYVADVREHDLLLGAEYCIGEEIPVDDDRLAELDYLLGGVHAVAVGGERYFFWGTNPPDDEDAFLTAYLELTLKAFLEDPLDVIAHPTYLPAPLSHRYDDFWNEQRCGELWAAASARGVAVEINGRWAVPGPKQIELGVEMGLTFAVGSDAHGRNELFNVDYPLRMVARFDIPENRIFLPRRKKT
ncbi:MAG TPA: PHP domain-containing protein [bacterium]|nr:PHP domain-containing protein [bacterium]